MNGVEKTEEKGVPEVSEANISRKGYYICIKYKKKNIYIHKKNGEETQKSTLQENLNVWYSKGAYV